jgi:hypothetical protein
MAKNEPQFTDAEVAARRDAAIRRALNTPPLPTKELVGKTERAKAQRESRQLKARLSKTKGDASS